MSRANAQRSWRLWRYLFHRLLGMVRPHLNHHQLEGLDKLGGIVALDGSLFDGLPRMCWVLYSSTKNKLKAHFFYNLEGLPDKLVLTTGKGSERSVLEQHLWQEVTYLLDRGYTDYDLFDTLIRANAHFVTRLRARTDFKLKTVHPVEAGAATLGVVAGQMIELKAKQAGPSELRLVTYQEPLTGKCYRYLTSRFDLESLSIVRLYLYRWEVELFIKWIKAHLRLDHWYSENENGVLIQLYAGLITFLLVKYFVALVAKPRYRVMNLETLRWLRLHLFEPSQTLEMAAYHQIFEASDTTFRYDATKPIVSYTGNAGSYTVDQFVNITCQASDNLSGLATTTCANITGPAYSFLANNTFSATATDKAGNVGYGTTSFTVTVTFDSLCTLSANFSTDPAVDRGLCDKLAAAKAAAASGDIKTKNNNLDAYRQQVAAQSGKALTTQQATILTNLSKLL